MKSAASGRYLEAAAAIVSRARAAGAIVVINDRADLAVLAGADGVHVGQDDIPPALLRRLAGPRLMVGLSTHTGPQIDAAVRQPVDYVAVGPVFGSTTKATGYEAVGLERIRMAASRAAERGLPLVAIGGITLDRAADVIAATC
jgi:thiamine-phosphate pyrophosphorylase